MKKFILILCSVLLLISCKKSNESPCKSSGVLVGYDYSMCSFCGGIKITIKNDTTTNQPPFYRIGKTLSELGIGENTKFPINVSLNWRRDTSVLKEGYYIIVDLIKVVK